MHGPPGQPPVSPADEVRRVVDRNGHAPDQEQDVLVLVWRSSGFRELEGTFTATYAKWSGVLKIRVMDMILEGETELRLKARTKFEKYDKYSRSETNRFGIVKSEDQNMSPTKTTRQRSYNTEHGGCSCHALSLSADQQFRQVLSHHPTQGGIAAHSAENRLGVSQGQAACRNHRPPQTRWRFFQVCLR